MGRQRKPGDIARQTLLELATRKLEPTPDNYHYLYTEIARGTPEPFTPGAEAALKHLAVHLPRDTPECARFAADLADALSAKDWQKMQGLVLEYVSALAAVPVSADDWAGVIRALVYHAGEGPCAELPAHRRAALEAALGVTDDARKLKRRLDTLAANWKSRHGAPLPTPATSGLDSTAPQASAMSAHLRELLAQTLETGIAAQLIHAPALAAEAGELAARLRNAQAPDIESLQARLKSLWLRVEAQGNRQNQLQAALLDLLHLMIDNVGELVADDQWLRGQMTIVTQAITAPLDIDALTQAKANLSEVIRKQSELKQGLTQVRASLKQMVVSFIDELGKLSATTGDYHDSVEHLSQKIRQTDDVNQLNQLIEEVLRETRDVQASTLRSRQEVLAARHRVDEAERKVVQLEAELQQASEKVQTDYLTGALNRRGLKEAFDRELAIAERENTPTSVALLDIDNFKDLNDNFGHQAGDNILVYLARLIKETVRPGDSVSRYGGEEFLILLPNADIEQACAVLTRLQRALTKHFFLHNNCKVLITFSTGITKRMSGETQESVIARADAALYQAKRGGKNRVVAVEADGMVWQPGPATSSNVAMHASA